MDVITQSCFLFLWLQLLTLVKSQEPCTLQQFIDGEHYDSNFDTTTMAASYPAGRQVRVGCNVGYSGFFRLVCVEGRWEARGTKCQPRSCGPPDDAQFADYHLAEGDDFVFGSRVVYTCQIGYQMTSTIHYRRCLADGWDGVVPVCEAVLGDPTTHCTLQQFIDGEHYDSNFDTTTMAASYPAGRQVTVGCNVGYSGFFRLVCVEGRWEAQGTKCQPRSCGPPDDAQFADYHLAEGDDFVFGSRVVYTCQTGYHMISHINYRRCLPDGWDGVVPVCKEAVGCGSPPHLEDGDILFSKKENYSHDESVEYQCQSYYTMEGEPFRTCVSGEWTGQMRCIRMQRYRSRVLPL